MLNRLGEAGADTFTIKRIAGHSSITVSERYVHPTPEGLERAFARLETFNIVAVAEGAEDRNVSDEAGQIAEPLEVEIWQERQAVPTVSSTVN